MLCGLTTGFDQYGDRRVTQASKKVYVHLYLLIHAFNYYCVTHLAVLMFTIIFVWKLSFIKLTLSERLKGPLRLISLAHWAIKPVYDICRLQTSSTADFRL